MFEFGQFARWIWCLALAGAGIIFGVVNEAVSNMSLASLIAFSIAGFVILLLILSVVIPAIASRLKVKPKSRTITTASKDDAVIEDGFEFYDSRDCLSKKHPLMDVFNSSKIIWAFWFTGTRAHAEDVIKGGKLKRLILSHPTNSSLALLGNVTSKDCKGLQDEIYAFTKEAIQERVSVRWYAGLTSSTMMLGEPGDEDGWIQVEPVIPFLLPIKSPGFRIYRCRHRKLYDDLYQAYQTLWDEGIEPTSQDLEGH